MNERMSEYKKHIPRNSLVFIFKCKNEGHLDEVISDEEFKKIQAEILSFTLKRGVKADIFTHI